MYNITPFKGRTLDPFKPVFVYRNLGAADPELFSVLQSGVVIGHTDAVSIRDARFIVRPAGHARTIREGKKCVHAFVKGWVTEYAPAEGVALRVKYDPRVSPTFNVPSLPGQYVTDAQLVTLDGSGMRASGRCNLHHHDA